MKKKESEKNKLIREYLEHKKWDVYKKIVPGTKQRGRGIYILYKGDRIHYIGLSKKSLRARLKKHTKDKHKGKWNNFSFYRVRRTKYIKDIESLLLRICNPAGNRISGRFRKKYDLSGRIR